MADEIMVQSSVRLTNGSLSATHDLGTQSIDQAGQRKSGDTQDIGTGAHEALVFGADFGTPGSGWFANLDDANVVQVGVDSAGTFEPFLTLQPGIGCWVPVGRKDLYAKATGGTVKLDYELYEA